MMATNKDSGLRQWYFITTSITDGLVLLLKHNMIEPKLFQILGIRKHEGQNIK